jgi:methionyl-tRNA formyltransferase
MSFIIAGKNNIACDCVQYLITHYTDTTIYIIPNTDSCCTWQRSLTITALENNIQIITLEEAYMLDNCIFISCEYDKIINPKQFRTDKLYNIHFSKLPKYKGMYTSCLPILYNEHETGVTLHKIDKGIDTGDIIDQITFPILASDVASDLYNKYTIYGFELFKNNINNLITGNFISTAQSSVNSSYYSKHTIDFKNILIDYKKTANEIKNQIHAYSFIYYQLPLFKDIQIIRAEILPDKSIGKLKEIVKETDDYIVINTIDYNIKLIKTCDTDVRRIHENTFANI